VPVERISRGFKDISSSFKVNPLSEDLIAIKNETAIARSVRNLILTSPGERFFNPILGSRVSKLLFESVDLITANAIEDEIRVTIENFEPRVELTSVDVKADLSGGEYNVAIRYNIIGIDALPQQLAFVLQPTR
jgi:phage baseplate assembly protein W|tara:strand:- start:313 stop:714 length:402 start_codon:yes stop_codon:yes gene_type:complete